MATQRLQIVDLYRIDEKHDGSDAKQQESADELRSIEMQLTKWLSNYGESVSEQQFTALLKKITPFVKDHEIKELFNSLDLENTGSINKDILLQSHYLANLIMRLYSDQRLHEEDDHKVPSTTLLHKVSSSEQNRLAFMGVVSIDVEMENDKLRRENEELQRWVSEIGKPAEIRAKRLEEAIQVYQDENVEFNTKIELLTTEHESLINLQSEVRSLNQMTNIMDKENQQLKRLQLDKTKSLQIEQLKLKETNKKIQNVEKLNKELTTINEQYRKRNNELNECKEDDQEQLQNMRSLIIEYQLQIQQLLNEKEDTLEQLKLKEDSLNIQKAEQEAKLQNEDGNIKDPSGIQHAVEHTLQYQGVQDLYNDIADKQSLNDMMSPIQSSTLRLTQRLSSKSFKRAGFTFNSTGHTKTNTLAMAAANTAPLTFNNDNDSLNGVYHGRDSTIFLPGLINDGQDNNVYDFVDDAMKKEIELEARQQALEEFKNRFDIEAKQIRVDAYIERQKDKNKYDKIISNLQNELIKSKEGKKLLKLQHRSEVNKYELKMKEIQNELKELNNKYNKNNNIEPHIMYENESDDDVNKMLLHQKRKKRTHRIHRTNDETCSTTTCSFPKLKQLFTKK